MLPNPIVIANPIERDFDQGVTTYFLKGIEHLLVKQKTVGV